MQTYTEMDSRGPYPNESYMPIGRRPKRFMSDTTVDIHEDEFNVMLSRPESKFYPHMTTTKTQKVPLAIFIVFGWKIQIIIHLTKDPQTSFLV